MKFWLVFACTIVAGFYFFGPDLSPEQKEKKTAPPAPPTRQPSQKLVVASIESSTQQLGKGSVSNDVEIIQLLLQYYIKTIGQAPIGENDEITAALTGKNTRGLIYIKDSHPAIVKGQLVDQHGTPYSFHPISSKLISIKSAGADRELHTADDISSSIIEQR